MGELETNIYPILNLNELSTRYRFVDVAGLHADQAEYFQNRQALERKLSYGLKRPVLVVERGDKPYLVAPEDVTMLPSEVNLVRTVVQLSPQADVHALDERAILVEPFKSSARVARRAPQLRDVRRLRQFTHQRVLAPA